MPLLGAPRAARPVRRCAHDLQFVVAPAQNAGHYALVPPTVRRSYLHLARAPRRRPGAVALAFAALGALWLFGHALMLRSVGAQFKEPVGAACGNHYPAGWYESTRVDWSWTGSPRQLRCDLFNPKTGESVTWNSGGATWPGFILARGAITAAALLVGAVLVSLFAGVVERLAHRSAPTSG